MLDEKEDIQSACGGATNEVFEFVCIIPSRKCELKIGEAKLAVLKGVKGEKRSYRPPG